MGKGEKARQTDLVKDFGFPEPRTKELKLNEKKEKKRERIEEIEEALYRLVQTVNKIMDSMMVQNKSIEGHSETLDVCITNQEKMVALVAKMTAEVAELQVKLGISSKPEKKTKTKLFYVS